MTTGDYDYNIWPLGYRNYDFYCTGYTSAIITTTARDGNETGGGVLYYNK